MKLNASDCYKKANENLLNKLVAIGWTVDNFGHAKKTIDGKVYRYKFQSHTIRYEIQVIHEATRYSPMSKSWVRIRTYEYKRLVNNVTV